MANSTKISEYSTTAANNTSIDSIDIDENCAASGINNAIRSVLKHQADAFTQGTPIALDQTNNRVGIGTTSPSYKLHSTTPTGSDYAGYFHNSAGSGNGTSLVARGGANNATPNFQVQDYDGNADFTVTGTGNVGIGTSSPASAAGKALVVHDTSSPRIRLTSDTTGQAATDGAEISLLSSAFVIENREASDTIFFNGGSERMRLTGTGTYTGSLILDKSSAGSPSATGIDISVYNGEANGIAISKNSTAWGTCLYLHRTFGVGDGNLIEFAHDTVTEGTITVSGGTVQLNGAHLSRWSQAADGNRITGLLRGTLMTNLDQMAVWSHDEVLWTSEDELPDGVSVGDVKTAAFTEDNEQLNCMAVSSVEGDPNVAGVFVDWDETDDFNDMHVAMTGDFVIRIASGTTVARGDLLMSAGDGTAKPQDDDIVRSKTIAKVTSTTVSHTYDDGSYLVPCVLMAC